MNHIVETVEPVSWGPSSAPNAAYSGLLHLLNNFPPHDEGVLFSFLADIEADPR